MEPADKMARRMYISTLEMIISSVGFHGGAVTFTKDIKTLDSTQDNPNKICLDGAKARHLLTNHLESKSHIKFEIWKKIYDVTTYKGNDVVHLV